jgi:Zn-dependent peptidase ImmA (M78 family)
MTIQEINNLAEEKARIYNPEGLSPFPFEKIQSDFKDLLIFYGNLKDDKSGMIFFDNNDNTYNIFINKDKSKTRQYFTLSHEVGHYFLHKDLLKGEEVIVDGDETLDHSGAVLYRLDAVEKNKIEIEANNFAASLIMPENLVRNAWNTVKDIEQCAKIFNVSVAAMSIRLVRLRLV